GSDSPSGSSQRRRNFHSDPSEAANCLAKGSAASRPRRCFVRARKSLASCAFSGFLISDSPPPRQQQSSAPSPKMMMAIWREKGLWGAAEGQKHAHRHLGVFPLGFGWDVKHFSFKDPLPAGVPHTRRWSLSRSSLKCRLSPSGISSNGRAFGY